MTTYTKNLFADGLEMYMMKSILEQPDAPLSWKNRIIGGFFTFTNFWNDSSSSTLAGRVAEEHMQIWRTYLSGDRTPMQEHVDSVTRGQVIVQQMAKEELSNPAVRWRIALYLVITIVLCVGAFKAFGVI